MPDKVDEIHDALMDDPDFKPETGNTKDESAWAVTNAKVNQMNSNEAAHELEREYAGFDFWKRHHKNLKKNTARLTPYEPQQTKRTLKKAGPPGPPPRPGLEWNANSHRWVRPKNNPANRELPKESRNEKDVLVNSLNSLFEEKNKLDSELEEAWAKAHAATREDRDEKISEAKKISRRVDSKLSEIHSVGTKLHGLWKEDSNMSISLLLKQGDTATSGPPRIPTKPHRMEPPKPSIVNKDDEMEKEIKKSLPSIIEKRYGKHLKKMGIVKENIKSPSFKSVKNYMKKNYNMDVVKVDNITEKEVKI